VNLPRTLLQAKSEHCKFWFSQTPKEVDYDLDGITADIFAYFVDWLYRDQLDCKPTTAECSIRLFRLAHRLKSFGLETITLAELHTFYNTSDVEVDHIILANNILPADSRLISTIVRQVALQMRYDKGYQKLYSHAKWEQLDREMLSKIMHSYRENAQSRITTLRYGARLETGVTALAPTMTLHDATVMSANPTSGSNPSDDSVQSPSRMPTDEASTLHSGNNEPDLAATCELSRATRARARHVARLDSAYGQERATLVRGRWTRGHSML
jgi:hypothetical protein